MKKSNTRKIRYTGIGARKNGIHTRKQFLKAVKPHTKMMCKVVKNCPKKNNVNGWVKWASAEYIN